MRFHCIALLIFFLASATCLGQSSESIGKAKQFLENALLSANFEPTLCKSFELSDHYTDEKTGTSYFYFQQTLQSLPVLRSIQAIAQNKHGAFFMTPRLSFKNIPSTNFENLKSKLTEKEAFQFVIEEMQTKDLLKKHQLKDVKYYGAKFIHAINKEWIPIYSIELNIPNSTFGFSSIVNAIDGTVYELNNHLISCEFSKEHFSNSKNHVHSKKLEEVQKSIDNTGAYRVIPFPIESPKHGDFMTVPNPADAEASPFGWHDTDGVFGAEYTITRGNNVHAFQDRSSTNLSSNDEPNGGPSLIFNPSFQNSNNPEDYTDAAVVNLFYWLNIAHDFSYHYGFTEAAGNFQEKNYSGQGVEGDYMIGNAQEGFQFGTTNQANYFGSGDGSPSLIQMYVWNSPKLLQVINPSNIAGHYITLPAQFGPSPPMTPFTSEVVEYQDAIYMPYPTDACEAAVNPEALAGKIALIDRGGCFFQQKVLNAQYAGAIAVIVCNSEPSAMNMLMNPNFNQPTIPAINLGGVDCETIRLQLDEPLVVSFGEHEISGPENIDADFDNGIICHEYAHGISQRMTGGPSSSGCLVNEEQMGEGWSDFFALAMTVSPGDTGSKKRGIGTYANNQDPDDRGSRRFHYSTDMSINPLTLNDVASNTEKHAIGEVWTAVLWDMYWALVDVYDFDTDLIKGVGGNNIAIRLVMEGFKLQTCQPGFIDARDAILAADQMLYAGQNQCLIWEVFARRGIGYYADQGSPLSATDQVENFDTRPTCIQELKMEKTVSKLIEPGDDISVKIRVINHDPLMQTNIRITEKFPEGLSLIENSISHSFNISNDEYTWELGNLAYLQEVELSYKLSSSADYVSTSMFFDGFEESGEFFTPIIIDGDNQWEVSQITSYESSYSYALLSSDNESQQMLISNSGIEITGEHPVLRFYQKFSTEAGRDGGILQISTDPTSEEWESTEELMFRGQYSGPIDYQTFVIPNLHAFSGNSEGWIATYLDVSEFSGQELFLRFNFASNDTKGPTSPENGFWAIDNLELMDMNYFNWESCLFASNGYSICKYAEEKGAIVNSDFPNAINYAEDNAIDLLIYPNPSSEFIHLTMKDKSMSIYGLKLMDASGKIVKATHGINARDYTIDIAGYPAGIYFLEIQANEKLVIEKLVIH